MTIRQRGFTLVELLIVLVILVILMTLAVVNLRSSLPKARDSERESDIHSIAKHLDSFARTKSSDNPASGQGRYIPTEALALGSESFASTYLPNIDQNALRAPEIDSSAPMSLVAATNREINPQVVSPRPTIDTYVYQPLQSDGTLCTLASQTCSVFYLYYMRETPSDDCVGSPPVYCMVKGRDL